MQYSVSLGGDKVGKVSLERRGLYYDINCSCRLSGQVICCLIAQSVLGKINFGILVPENGFFQLKTSLPVKKLDPQSVEFVIEPKHSTVDTLFIPIRAEEPFGYLDQLTDAYLAVRGDQIGVEITAAQNERAISRPTGQWSEPNVSE